MTQMIHPGQIAPGSDGQVLATANGVTGWRAASGGSAGPSQLVSLSDFYATATSTDDDAFQAFADAFNTGSLGNCRLVVPASRGRGNVTTGNYFLSREIVFRAAFGLEIDGSGSLIRMTGASARLRYSPPAYGGANATPYPFFAVRNFLVQAAAEVDCFAFWDIPYSPSRINGSGYAENVRMSPHLANTASHAPKSMFRLRNTWAFTATRCHFAGKARTPADLAQYPDVVGVRQDGVCIVTDLLSCEFNYVYQMIGVGTATLTGLDGSFTQSGSLPLQKGNRIVQGSASGYLGRADGGYGYGYSLYDVSGTFAPGTAQVYDHTGATLIGSISITAAATYRQASEAISFDAGTAAAQCTYGFKWAKPAGLADHLLNIVFGNCHIAPHVKAIEADGVSAFAITDAANFLPKIANCPGLIDINNGYLLHIGGFTASNNGAAGATAIRLRNTFVFSITGPKLATFAVPLDVDNTVKEGSVEGLCCDQATGKIILNGANRYNGTSVRGIRFRNNGLVGVGIDQDDANIKTWTPVVTSSQGTIGSATATGTYVLENGKFTFTISVQVTDRGSANGPLGLTLPDEITNATGITLRDTTVSARNSNGPAFPMMAFVGVNALGAGKRGIVVEHVNPGYGAFANYGGVPGNYNYLVSGSVPIRLN